VRILTAETHSPTRFGSHGVTLARAGAPEEGQVYVHVATFEPGGTLGRHPAVGWQLLTVVAGAGTVAGGDGVHVPIGPGQAVLWEPGEEHETIAIEPMKAVIVESKGPLA
jgi:quercetin dioxygenase-like cupin family protein